MLTENLASLKDDMIAFIAGNGLRRVSAYVSEDVPSVVFEEDNVDSWKDFVEHAKASGAAFLTMSEVVLEKTDVEILVQQLREQSFPDPDSHEIAEAQYLAEHVGKTGYLQLGFAHQGVMFLYETETEWYDRFQQILEAVGELGRIVVDEDDED
jgi:hypothetical protein